MTNSDPMYFETTMLPSGLKVCYRHEPVNRLECLINLHVGHRFDPVGKEGLSHLLEHYVNSGTEALEVANFTELKRWLFEQRYQMMQGRTSNYHTEYGIRSTADRAIPMLEFLHRFVFKPKLDADLAHDREIVRNERVDAARPERTEAMNAAIDRAFLGNHRLMTVEALPEDAVLNAITQEELRAHHAKYYDPRNAILVLAGDVDFEQLLPELAKIFVHRSEAFAGSPAIQPVQPRTPWPKEQIFRPSSKRPVRNTRLEFIWAIKSNAKGESLDAIVVNNVLHDRLNHRIREEMRAVYGVEIKRHSGPEFSTMTIGVTCDTDRVSAIRGAIESVVADHEGILSEVESMKEKVAFLILMNDDALSDRVVAACRQMRYEGEILTNTERAKRFAALTKDDIARFLKKELTPDHCQVVTIENPE